MENKQEWSIVRLQVLKKLFDQGHAVKSLAKIFKTNEDDIRLQLIKSRNMGL